ncbi:GNAT family N-acetyltransferase [Actinomadura darangshiensis]|uniref:GNAT family N-acetyltransferase n=1 Tax=Actinomadura darangshiensis TaxID=705336 RepID=A0A4R5BKW3_9ACTN|nr:GNAT family N-acetyltransferase [Actinomadura darangshiensis]TDD86349.1 GNAT family N-acetyltransferase [Actinomadura darangshiensis]
MEIRTLAWEEHGAVRDIRARAFGPLSDEAWRWRMEALHRPSFETGRQFAVFEDGRIVATAALHEMTQWWHGRAVSMGGVSGVTVAPEERGRGLGRGLVTGVLERCAAFGHPLAVLYPATTRLYRLLGWEHAGAQHHIEFPAEVLRTVAAGRVPVRRAGPQDAAEVAAVIGRTHESARDCGPVGWTEPRWRGALGSRDDYAYLAEDGFLSYRWSEGGSGLEVNRLVASSEATLRALWAIVGSGSSTAETIRACVSPMDPVLWLPGEREHENVHRSQWMLRVVDAPAAIAARGYPAGVTAGVPLDIDDPQRPANSGHWRLEVKDGEGRLERSAEDAGAVRLGPRGLSALYAGVPVPTLRRSGLLQGGDADALSAVFAATPFSLDYF